MVAEITAAATLIEQTFGWRWEPGDIKASPLAAFCV